MVGRNNPWAGEWACPRKDCAPCAGRGLLAQEAEEEASKLLQVTESKEDVKPVLKRKPEDKVSIPSCTTEGVNYTLECWTCRKEGTKRIYYGETSRSPYQRGIEHFREVREGFISHPMTVHFWEEHAGVKQEVLMRVLSRHLTALDRQVQESVNILESGKVPEESLNSKNEWGGAKIPSILVSSPKGIAKAQVGEKEGQETAKEELPEHITVFRKAISRGQKRIQYREGNQEADLEAEETILQEDSGQERVFNPRKRMRGNAMRKVVQERKDLSSPEQYRSTGKEGSPKPRTFTELALLKTEAKWNAGRKRIQVPGRLG